MLLTRPRLRRREGEAAPRGDDATGSARPSCRPPRPGARAHLRSRPRPRPRPRRGGAQPAGSAGHSALQAGRACAPQAPPPAPARAGEAPSSPSSWALPPGPPLRPSPVYLGRPGICQGLDGGAEGRPAARPSGAPEVWHPQAGPATPRPRLPPCGGSRGVSLGAGPERQLRGGRSHQAFSRETAEAPPGEGPEGVREAPRAGGEGSPGPAAGRCGVCCARCLPRAPWAAGGGARGAGAGARLQGACGSSRPPTAGARVTS